MTTKWHYSATLAGNQNGPTHYDIGGDDNSNVAIVYPSEDGHEDTLRKARVIAASPELADFAEQIFNGIDTGMILLDTPAPETLEKILVQGRKALARVKGDGDYRSPPLLGSAL